MSDLAEAQDSGTPESAAKTIVRRLVRKPATAAAAAGAVAGAAAGKVAGAALGAATAASGSLKNVAGKGAGVASESYRRTGAKAVVDRAGEKLDEVTGKAILEEVKLLVQRQAVYNDVLATKLQEALDRIAELEARIERP